VTTGKVFCWELVFERASLRIPGTMRRRSTNSTTKIAANRDSTYSPADTAKGKRRPQPPCNLKKVLHCGVVKVRPQVHIAQSRCVIGHQNGF
jgi:hypothetical protein